MLFLEFGGDLVWWWFLYPTFTVLQIEIIQISGEYVSCFVIEQETNRTSPCYWYTAWFFTWSPDWRKNNSNKLRSTGNKRSNNDLLDDSFLEIASVLTPNKGHEATANADVAFENAWGQHALVTQCMKINGDFFSATHGMTSNTIDIGCAIRTWWKLAVVDIWWKWRRKWSCSVGWEAAQVVWRHGWNTTTRTSRLSRPPAIGLGIFNHNVRTFLGLGWILFDNCHRNRRHGQERAGKHQLVATFPMSWRRSPELDQLSDWNFNIIGFSWNWGFVNVVEKGSNSNVEFVVFVFAISRQIIRLLMGMMATTASIEDVWLLPIINIFLNVRHATDSQVQSCIRNWAIALDQIKVIDETPSWNRHGFIFVRIFQHRR